MMNKNGIIATTTNRNVVPSSTSTSSSTTTDNSFSTNSNNVKIISTSSLLNDSNDWWIDQVLELQKSNHKHELVGQDDDNNEMGDDGFLTVRHEKSDLIEMAKYCPQFLAVDDDSDDKDHPKVIGYTLTVDRNTLDKCPNLSKLYKIFFDMTDDVVIIEEDDATTSTVAGSSSSSLKDMNWVLGAQVCVSKDYRRRGILQKLYDMQMNYLVKDFGGIDAIVTAVDHANNASLKAHSKAKFDTLKGFDTGGKDNTGWSLIIRRRINGKKKNNNNNNNNNKVTN